MSRQSFALFGLFLLSFFVTACSGGGSTTPSSPATKAPTPTPTPSPSPSPSPTGSTTPTATPTPSTSPSGMPSALLLAENDPATATNPVGINEYNAVTGARIATFATSLGSAQTTLGADDSGNVYMYNPDFNGQQVIFKVALGGNTALAQYVPTQNVDAIAVSPAGEVVAAESYVNMTTSVQSNVFDVWDAGKSGAPSRTFNYAAIANNVEPFALDPNGTLYIGYPSSGTVKYDVFPAGQGSPSRTIAESIVPTGSVFEPNWLLATSDGTLYVGEWSFTSSDTNAGLYVYPASGMETANTTMAQGINGLDYDAAGNIYVASNNSSFSSTSSNETQVSNDTAQQISVYSTQAKTLLRQFSDGVPGVTSLTVGNDGTAYLIQQPGGAMNDPSVTGFYKIPAGSTSPASLLVSGDYTVNLVLESGGTSKQYRKSHTAVTGSARSEGAVHSRAARLWRS